MFFTDTIRTTFPEHYPDGLKDLMLPMVSIRLAPGDTHVIGRFCMNFRAGTTGQGADWFSDAFLDTLDAVMAQFPEGVMPRIGFCSWKAGTLVNEPAIGTRGVMRVLSQDDPRIGAAMMAHVATGEPAVLHLRPWVRIHPWAEFRMFIRDGRVIGASQYLHRDTFPAITQNEGPILAALQVFATVLLDALHVDTVVADVFLTPQGTGFRTTLIELNPFIPATDACLFTWAKGGDFDGGFRFNRVRTTAHGAAQGASAPIAKPGSDHDYWVSEA